MQIRVFCRIKPHLKPALVCLPDGSSVKAEIDGKEQSFAFDKVFGASSTQQAVFDEVAELVQSALDGYQVCHSIFNAAFLEEHRPVDFAKMVFVSWSCKALKRG